jgi:hypothetical protein
MARPTLHRGARPRPREGIHGNVDASAVAWRSGQRPWAVNGTTTGLCDWTHPTGPILAKCTFDTGTGTLTGFHVAVKVTANANGSVWYWDGTYWFG